LKLLEKLLLRSKSIADLSEQAILFGLERGDVYRNKDQPYVRSKAEVAWIE